MLNNVTNCRPKICLVITLMIVMSSEDVRWLWVWPSIKDSYTSRHGVGGNVLKG